VSGSAKKGIGVKPRPEPGESEGKHGGVVGNARKNGRLGQNSKRWKTPHIVFHQRTVKTTDKNLDKTRKKMSTSYIKKLSTKGRKEYADDGRGELKFNWGCFMEYKGDYSHQGGRTTAFQGRKDLQFYHRGTARSNWEAIAAANLQPSKE